MALTSPRRDRPIFLIVNGDDFGYTPEINAAIARCHDAGVLTSATLLVNRAATGDALALAAARPELGLGLHLNLTEGAPVAPPRQVRSLVDRRGRFIPFPAQLGRIASGAARGGELEAELRAQFERFLGSDRIPSHVDGHLHVHAYPRVLPLVVRLMREYGVQAMRNPLLGAWLFRSPVAPLPASTNTRRYVVSRRHGLDRWSIARTERLFDLARLLRRPDPSAALVATVARSGARTVEVMAHPAWNRGPAVGAAQTALLTAPGTRAALERAGLVLGDYRQLRCFTREASWPEAAATPKRSA